MCCARQPLLQSGHSGFSLTQSPIHVQQNTCPHCVALGSFRSSKHNVQRRCWAPLIHAITSSPLSSTLGTLRTGVCIALSIFMVDPAPVEASSISSLLEVNEFSLREISTPLSRTAVPLAWAFALWAGCENSATVELRCIQLWTAIWRTRRTPRTS